MISVQNLGKVFTKQLRGKGIKGFFFPQKKSFEAVNNITFDIKPGEIVGFVGPNGAGKSTTIKMLTGIIYPTTGKIKVAGYKPTLERKKLAYEIGCMFGQKSGLWMHLPAIDTYYLLGAMYDIPKQDLEFRIQDLIKEFAIEEIVHIPVRKLSLGQRMICEIVAILLHNPKILFLDEPTIGLDIVVKEKVRRAILNANQKYGTTIFLTSHDLGDIEKLCNRIIIIDKGRIIKDESIGMLKQEYLSERFITILYEEAVADNIPENLVVSKAENKVVIKIDTNQKSVADVLKEFMEYGNIVDLEAIPVPLEDVIYDIYTR